MGLSKSSIAFLATSKRLGASYEKTLQLGRQSLADHISLSGPLSEGGIHDSSSGIERNGYADGLLGFLGAEVVDSVDASDWEGATVVHDLNKPFPETMRDKYSVVLDGGTLEHVFEFPTALRSSLDAVRANGHFISITPTNNFSGHGFYQLSPELYFSFLAVAGFEVDVALVRTSRPGARWYRVTDPREVRSRVELNGMLFPQLFYLSARRVQMLDLDQVVPQQSDYAAAWSQGRPPPRRLNQFRRYFTKRTLPLASEVRTAMWAVSRFPPTSRPQLRPVKLADLR